MKKILQTLKAPKAAGPYSQAVAVGNVVYASGQIALTPEGKLVQDSINDEVVQVMTNLQAVLAAAGLGFGDVVKTTLYMTDLSEFQAANNAYAQYFTDGQPPARETVGAASLPLGARVEISMIAIKSEDKS